MGDVFVEILCIITEENKCVRNKIKVSCYKKKFLHGPISMTDNYKLLSKIFIAIFHLYIVYFSLRVMVQ